MHNLVYLIGRITDEPEIKELESGKKVLNLTLAVQRNYKNEEGIYETDFINCCLWNSIAEHTSEYCKKGDLVGVKGRLQVDKYEKDGQQKTSMSVVTEKVSFLSTRKEPDYDRE